MRVADVMKTDLAVINEDVPIRSAVILIADAHVLGVPVVDRRGRLVGALSASDIVQAAAERAEAGEAAELLSDTRVSDIMSTPARTIAPDADVRDAAREMRHRDVHRLFVVHGDDLLGVISTSDIVRAVADGTV